MSFCATSLDLSLMYTSQNPCSMNSSPRRIFFLIISSSSVSSYSSPLSYSVYEHSLLSQPPNCVFKKDPLNAPIPMFFMSGKSRYYKYIQLANADPSTEWTFGKNPSTSCELQKHTPGMISKSGALKDRMAQF